MREGRFYFTYRYDNKRKYEKRKDRNTWLPDPDLQVGWGWGPSLHANKLRDKGAVYWRRSGMFTMIDETITSFTNVPEDCVFTTQQEETFFRIFNRRKWYLFLDLKTGIFYVRYAN